MVENPDEGKFESVYCIMLVTPVNGSLSKGLPDTNKLGCVVLQENEDAVSFAGRVKAVIAKQGGLVDLEW